MKVFVSAPDAVDGPLIHPSDFEQALRERWPDAILAHPRHVDDTHALDWQVVMRHGLVVGALAKDGEIIICDGDVRDCAEVARWYRQLIRSDQPLVFYDEDYCASVELRRDTTSEDLVRPFTA